MASYQLVFVLKQHRGLFISAVGAHRWERSGDAHVPKRRYALLRKAMQSYDFSAEQHVMEHTFFHPSSKKSDFEHEFNIV